MSTSTPSITTAEQLLALPEDGVDRELIRGKLRERPMTRRSRIHSASVSRISRLLLNWMDTQPQPHGDVLAGEAGFILRRGPDTLVGIDVAYISAETAAAQTAATTLVEGVPVLAVEVLSPSDKHEEVTEKIDEYLAAGVALVWIVDPHFRTVRVHRPGAEPEMFNATQQLSGEPYLPGFSALVADMVPQ